MAEEVYGWNWRPSSKADAEAWLSYDNYLKRANVARSEFADETVIREMVSHSWGNSDSAGIILAALAENPNFTLELTEWVHAQSTNWSLESQHEYWLTRYDVAVVNLGFPQGHDQRGATRTFPTEFIGSKLDGDAASRITLEIADQFMEQMWHDLSDQKHLELHFFNEYRGATFAPTDLGRASEEIIKFFSPGDFVTWVSREEKFDFDHASDLAYNDQGKCHFEDKSYVWQIVDEPFCGPNLGLAIGAGLQANDLKVLNSERYKGYLEELHSDDREMYEVSINTVGETPWHGTRYSDLSDDQKWNLTLNIISTLQHPYLGREDGISIHLLDCLAKHNQTPEAVRDLIISKLEEPNPAASEY